MRQHTEGERIEPYECYACKRPLTKGDMVVPVVQVASTIYMVEVYPHINYYIHIGCVRLDIGQA